MTDKLLMCHLIRVIIYLIDIKKLGHHLYAQKKKKKKLPHQHFKILIYFDKVKKVKKKKKIFSLPPKKKIPNFFGHQT